LPSKTTIKILADSQEECSNQEVVEMIIKTNQDPDTSYGYQKMTHHLAHQGYLINHKKVYRLMDKASLLQEKPTKSVKTYVQYRIVIPTRPLEVLEMDIKMVWVAKDRRHAYILTIIDTFTRVVLHWTMGYQMTNTQVRSAWEHVIIEHLQPAEVLSRGLHIELRNDNGPQFCASNIKSFFEENHISQVFTHPYTPQENGHVESFHYILKKAIDKQVFWSFSQLEERLILFYEKYNNVRIHASIAYLWPHKFWELWNENKIERIELSNRKVKFKLLIPRYTISGNKSLREVPCSKSNPLDGDEILCNNEAYGPETLQTTSVQKSPSVVPC
jgi:transposase InsO family protein